MRHCLPAFYGPGPSVQTLIGVGGLIGRLFCRHIEHLGQVLPQLTIYRVESREKHSDPLKLSVASSGAEQGTVNKSRLQGSEMAI